MLEQTTRLVSENLARALNRRAFLKRTGETAFLGLASLAVGHGLSGAASASGIGGGTDSKAPPNISCSPPGPYCSVNGQPTDGCHGGSCFQHMVSGTIYQCRVYYTYYQGGCWTTAQGGGYWTCCDCSCTNGSTCGCAQFSLSPVPRPDSPTGGSLG